MNGSGRTIGVLCVDDNRAIGEGLALAMQGEEGLRWLGQVTEAGGLVGAWRELRPDVVLLDIDMPGKDPVAAMRDVAAEAALAGAEGARVVAFSGHVRRDLIDRVIAAGAWGYISKSDEMGKVLEAVRRVAEGEFVLSGDVEESLRG